MVRYADDFVILCRTVEQAEAALIQVQEWTSANGLTLHPEKTRIVNVDAEAVEFLGDSFFGEHRWPRKKSLQKLKETLRQKTKRANSHSLPYPYRHFDHGWHLAFDHDNNTPLCNLYVSMLQHMGVETDALGSSTGTLNGLEFKR